MDKFLSKSEKETKEVAASLLEGCQRVLQQKAFLLTLEGELGTGKTTFAKGVGEHLGIRRPIRSPGFVLVTEYPIESGRLFHIDLWRVESENEARALGIEKMIKPGNVILIEWAQKIPKLLNELHQRNGLKIVDVRFAHKGGNKREIKITNVQ